MFHELEIIDDFVLNKLNPLNCTAESPEVLVEWLCVLQTEEHNIKTKIAEDALKLPNETHIEVFIHNIQRRLTTLADKLYSYQNFNEVTFDFSNNDPLSLSKLQKYAYQTLEDLIDYLMVHFDRFFLFDEKPPRRRVLIAVLQFTQNINDLQELTNESNVFLSAIVSTISDSIHNPEKITFRIINYLRKLVQEIQGFNHQSIENNLSVYIKYKALYMNFNSVSFAMVITTEYAKEQEILTSPYDKIDKLAWYLKRITQVPVQNKAIYDPNHNSLKEQVSQWILEEMCFLEKRFVLSNIHDHEKNSNATSTFKIPIDMSVPQLAYFLKVLVKSKVIKNVKDKELLKHFANHSKTRGTENISPESLRIKFYDIEDSTKEEVKSIIIRLLNFIQNNKNYIIFLLNASILQLDNAICYISEYC